MAKMIAERVTDSRALEGFLLKLSSLTLDNSLVTPQKIAQALGKPRESNAVIHPDIIIQCVCDYYNIRTTQLKGAKRQAMLVRPRHICMYRLLYVFAT